jgi:hypothetical protein
VKEQLLRRCEECVNDESPSAVDVKLQALSRCRTAVEGESTPSLEIQLQTLREKCDEGNQLMVEFSPNQEPIAIPEFPGGNEFRARFAEMMEKIDDKKQELEFELNSNAHPQGKHELRLRELFRSCEVAKRNLMKTRDVSEIEGKRQELAEFKSALDRESFESLCQRWQTSGKAGTSPLIDVTELRRQLSDMSLRVDQKREELDRFLELWQSVETMQNRIKDLNDIFKTEFQKKGHLLDECQAFVCGLPDDEDVSDLGKTNRTLQKWEKSLELPPFKSLRNLLEEICTLSEKRNRLAE